jgi:hypothetical protein
MRAMKSDRLGLSLLKMKFPRLREHLDSAFIDSENLRDICRSYGEAIGYRDLLRRGGDPGLLAEYDLICSELEADVRDEVAPTLSWAMTDRNT